MCSRGSHEMSTGKALQLSLAKQKVNPMMLGKQFPMLTLIDMEDYRFS